MLICISFPLRERKHRNKALRCSEDSKIDNCIARSILKKKAKNVRQRKFLKKERKKVNTNFAKRKDKKVGLL